MNRGLLALLAGAVVLYVMDQSHAQDTPQAPEGKAAFVAELFGIVSALVTPKGWTRAVALLLVAWAAMESAFGSSRLALEANNLFGIKAGPTWKGQGSPFVTFTTHEHQGQPGYPPEGETITATFRRYPSWTASVQDLLHMLSITTVYKPAYDALARADIQGFFQAIDASGYSTASKYSARIQGALDTVTRLA